MWLNELDVDKIYSKHRQFDVDLTLIDYMPCLSPSQTPNFETAIVCH